MSHRERPARPFPWPILMYHHVETLPLEPPPVHAGSYLDLPRLRRQLDWLAGHGYQTLTLAEAAAAWKQGRRTPRRAVVLTFDDGCRCFAENAWPELERRGQKATLFAVSGLLGEQNRWDQAPKPGERGERPEHLLAAADLRRLAEAGVEIAAHGHTHADLTACSAEELAEETSGCKQALEDVLGRPVETFCYPYGRLDARARNATEAAGYTAAVGIDATTSPHAPDPRDPYALPREIVRAGESLFEFQLKARGLYPLYRRLPRLGLLRWLRGNLSV